MEMAMEGGVATRPPKPLSAGVLTKEDSQGGWNAMQVEDEYSAEALTDVLIIY
jgi:hypothetical protein